MIDITQWCAEIGSFYCSSKIICRKRKFYSEKNSFDSLIPSPFFIASKKFHSNFLMCWFILSKALKVLYIKFLESVANITAKFRFHTRINFLIQLNYLFSLYLYSLCIIQNVNIELNPSTKSSFLSVLPICPWNLNCSVAHSFSKVNTIQAYNSIHSFDIICLSETFLDSTIGLDHRDLSINK